MRQIEIALAMGLLGWVMGVAWAEESAAPSQGADRANYLAPLLAKMEKDWPENRTINIVCHGHSVPAGYFATPKVDSFNAYPHLLHVALKEQYAEAVLNVIVTAIGGETSDKGAARFERDVLTHRPDLITIDYSLNDRRIGLEKAHQAWTAMIVAAKERGIPVLLFTPTADTREDLGSQDAPLAEHAAQVRRLAAEHRVGLVDSYAAFERVAPRLEEYMSQVNHPNRKGHELVVGELVKWFGVDR